MNAECRTKTGKTKRTIFLRSSFCILTSALIFQSGCTTIGAVGGVIAQAVPKKVDAAYKGLANQTVIVMVWLDRGLKLDFPDLQLDIAASLQNKLIDEAKTEKPDVLKGTEFPVMASTVIHYQDDHPEMDNQSITDVAGKFDGTRLIYVEIKDFATHAGAPELFRGTLKGNIKVIAMKDGKAKVDWSDGEDIEVTYPKDSPKDGLPIGTEYSITTGTVDLFTTEVAKRFYPYEEDRD